MLNWGTFAHICKNQNMKSSSLVALQGQGRLRFTCLVVQLIKQLDCFQDSSTPALSFIFLCHYFYGRKKDLFPWNSEVVNLYFAWNKNIFCKWNACGNTPASSVCLVCYDLYIGGAKTIFRQLKKKGKKIYFYSLWPDVDKPCEWLTNLKVTLSIFNM